MAEENALYLFHLPNESIKNRTYAKFYKPVFDAISSATNNNAKWGWCNYNSSEIEEMINHDKQLQPYSEIVLRHYFEYSAKEYSVYIGEFFYYHMTSQPEFLKLVDSSKCDKYLKEMLNMHIDEIEKSNNTVSFIVINNATASRMLCDALNIGDYPSFYDYSYNGCTYRLFFSAMLSGPAMDVFSKNRLISEMKEYLINKQHLNN